MSDLGWVYFISTGEAVKIGFASVITKRMKALQTGHHQSLKLLAKVQGGQRMEKAYHERFAADRIRGEWFRISDAVRLEIDRLNGIVIPPKPEREPRPARHTDVSRDVGRLIKLRDAHKGNLPITERLCIGVQQLREYSRAPYQTRLALVKAMKRTRAGLAELGVFV